MKKEKRLTICLSEEQLRHLEKWGLMEHRRLTALVRDTILRESGYGQCNLVIKQFPRAQPAESRIMAIIGN